MEDARVWAFEESLWKATPEHYHESIHPDCLMALPAPPYIVGGSEAADAVSNTPRWAEAAFSEQRVTRPQEGLIVIAYRIAARREGAEPYDAHCTSVYLRLGHEHWQVVEHSQVPMLASSGESGATR